MAKSASVPPDTDRHGTPRYVAQRYRLDTPIGRGGAGVVWRGEDELLQRPVAIKEILVPMAGAQNERDAIRARVLREARALARLHSPAIVSVYDVVEEHQRHWIVMELVDADSLGDVIRNHGPLPFDQVAAIGLALTDALAAAHSAGVLHRDVKPGNVLLGRDGRVRLTDFGIAATEGDVTLTGTGALVGSPAYIAPERVRGSSGSPASDLWGLGATLYSAVEGQPPFEGPETYAVLTAVVEGRRRAFRLAGPLRNLLSDLMDRPAEERPDVTEIRRRLIPVARNATPVPASVMHARTRDREDDAGPSAADVGLENLDDAHPSAPPVREGRAGRGLSKRAAAAAAGAGAEDAGSAERSPDGQTRTTGPRAGGLGPASNAAAAGAAASSSGSTGPRAGGTSEKPDPASSSGSGTGKPSAEAPAGGGAALASRAGAAGDAGDADTEITADPIPNALGETAISPATGGLRRAPSTPSSFPRTRGQADHDEPTRIGRTDAQATGPVRGGSDDETRIGTAPLIATPDFGLFDDDHAAGLVPLDEARRRGEVPPRGGTAGSDRWEQQQRSRHRRMAAIAAGAVAALAIVAVVLALTLPGGNTSGDHTDLSPQGTTGGPTLVPSSVPTVTSQPPVTAPVVVPQTPQYHRPRATTTPPPVTTTPAAPTTTAPATPTTPPSAPSQTATATPTSGGSTSLPVTPTKPGPSATAGAPTPTAGGTAQPGKAVND
ncbi:eukaryotic-like serine/threonine-protein kinase [Frankia sp. AiPs1]|uniref:serine/threonine-protein kinase n=1 Tax=Frankia sp. AiPa1 TaxID=573492 RepID=UPI00202AF322|nr:serine/threonine-protein kinase [Frankia sp. AiPa1]MCL9757730.1 serine/threonine protein kinase [Frankia sp. AiPa1]